MEISGGEMWDLRWCEINGGGISGGLRWVLGGLRWVFRWLEVEFHVVSGGISDG